MRKRLLLLVTCLVALTACGGGGSPMSLPNHWSSYAQVGLYEEDGVRADPADGKKVCTTTEDPETFEVWNPAMGTTDSFFRVAILELGPRPGLGLSEHRALGVEFKMSPGLFVAIDDDMTDGPNNFEMLDSRDAKYVLAEWERTDDWKYIFVTRNIFVLVFSNSMPLTEPGEVTINFRYGFREVVTKELGSETYNFRNCGSEPDPDPDEDPEDPGDPRDAIYNFPIPPEARDPDSLTAVTEKDPLAICHVVLPELSLGSLSLTLAKVTDEITSFISGLAPAQLALLARTIDREDGLLVSDSPLLVPDDVPYPDGFPGRWSRKDLFHLDMETGDVYRLTRHREDGFTVGEARWSPTGDRIAYLLVDFRDPLSGVSSALWLRDRGTGESTWLADDAQGSVGWSPDGETIIYTSPEGDLRAIEADGTDERLLLAKGEVHSSLVEIRYPDWHPTENRIVFVGMGTGNLRGGPVYVFDLDTNSVTELTDGMNDGLLPKETAEDRYPVWSPDGTYVAFVRRTSSSVFSMLMILDVEGGGSPVEIAETREYRNLDW